METIKFRAWDIVAKQMIELHGWQDDPATYNRYRIMQFTGLLDKNGKEIYEGDIVKQEMYFNLGASWHLGRIEFRNAMFAFIDHGKEYGEKYVGSCFYRTNNNPITIEILGNIYENPELLTQ